MLPRNMLSDPRSQCLDAQMVLRSPTHGGSCTNHHPPNNLIALTVFFKLLIEVFLSSCFIPMVGALHVAFRLSSRNPFAPSAASKTPRCKVFSNAFCNGCVNLSCEVLEEMNLDSPETSPANSFAERMKILTARCVLKKKIYIYIYIYS